MENLINPIILGLRPYQAGKPIEEVMREYNPEKVVKLASNENPFPLPQNVTDAIKREIDTLGLYPDGDSYILRKRIAEVNHVNLENVIVGSGSVELIRIIGKVFLKPGEKLLTAKSTFPMFKAAARENYGGQAVIEADMDIGYGFDLDEMAGLMDDHTKVIFIANPNNPTGTMLPKKRLLDFIESVPEDRIIVLDNAYEEYVEHAEEHVNGIDLALKRKNLIILRTFSKIYALAGLRIGYAVSNKDIISFLNRAKAPFNVTRVAQEAAIASLTSDAFKRQSAELNHKNRKILYNQLIEMGLKVIPSETNFLLFFPGKDVLAVNERLLKEGVIIRPLPAFGVPDGMRVTVGFEEDNNYFIQKLKKVLDG